MPVTQTIIARSYAGLTLTASIHNRLTDADLAPGRTIEVEEINADGGIYSIVITHATTLVSAVTGRLKLFDADGLVDNDQLFTFAGTDGEIVDTGAAVLDSAYLFDDGFGRKAINSNVTHYQGTLQGNGDLPAKLDAIRTDTHVDIPAQIDGIGGGEATLSQEGLNSIIAGVQSVHVGITEAVENSALTIIRGDTWVQSITGLGTLTGKKVTFALKINARDTDANAVIFIDEDTGLTTIKGVTAPDASLGSITIDDASAGDITIRLESSVTLQLATGQYHDALKAIKDNADFTLRNNGVTTVILGVIQEVS